MKNRIEKIALFCSGLYLVFTVFHFIYGILGGYLFSGNPNEYEYFFEILVLLGATVLFLCLYRIIDLMEHGKKGKNKQK